MTDAMTIDRNELLDRLVPAMRRAGELILQIRDRGLTVEEKADRSPVTEADRVAEAEIVAALKAAAPGIPIVAEELVAAGSVPTVTDGYFLVDALDGTREFVNGRDDFTVNVGLIVGGAPVLGAVFLPATGRLYAGSVGEGAWVVGPGEAWPEDRRPIAVRRPPAQLGIVASRSHRTPETDAFIDRFPGSEVVSAGSSLKFCVLAEGKADLYPRLSPTSQWDTAAGDAVLRAAGGRVLGLDGRPLAYRPAKDAAGFLNPSFVAATGIDPFGPTRG